MTLSKYFEGDKITRLFIKQRGSSNVSYQFACRSTIFEPDICDDTLNKLNMYLQEILTKGTVYLEQGCSNCKEILGLQMKQKKETSVVKICSESNHIGGGMHMHDIAQNHFFVFDPYTIALEIPVYSEKHNRSGFIDLIRYNPATKKIWILDFKPNAHKERYQKVLSQLFWYRQMLAEKLGLPLTDFECAYFDERNFYQLV